MGSRDAYSEWILDGRDPVWREAWEEHLSQADREEVDRSLLEGRAPEESRLAPFVIGAARKKLRGGRWMALSGLLTLTVGSLMLYFNCLNFGRAGHNTVLCLIWIAIVGTLLTVVPLGWRKGVARAKAAESASLALLPDKVGSPGDP